MKTIGRKLAHAIGGYWLFDLLYDDRQGGRSLEGFFPCSPWWLDLWWGDEKSPPWLNQLVSVVRRCWYRGKTTTCTCDGCKHVIPMWWSTPMCLCCCQDEECCHDEPTEAA